MKIFLGLALAFTASKGSFSPQRTAMRDKLFFGIDDASDSGTSYSASGAPSGFVGAPPANSQLGVNSTATSNVDLNDYGSLGPPAEVVAKRAQAAVDAAAAKLSFFSFGSSSTKEGSVFSARNVLNTISVLWLVALVGGLYYFLRQAIEGANRKYRIGTSKKVTPTNKAVENMRIDREAYVYVADG
jgi:hypothetical protein